MPAPYIPSFCGNVSYLDCIQDQPRSSLVEGDEQLERPNSQATMKFCHACVAQFIGVEPKHNSFLLVMIKPLSPTTK